MFPSDVSQIEFDDERTSTSSVTMEMSNEYLGLWTDELPYPFYSTPVDVLFTIVSFVCSGDACDDLLWMFDIDNFVRFREYEVGQRVELTRKPLMQSTFYPPFKRKEIVDATVTRTHTKNRTIDEFEYDVRVDDEEEETHVKYSSSLRLKAPSILFTTDDIITQFASDNMSYVDLLKLTPNKNPVVLIGTRFLTILQGYSPSSKTLWEYIEFQNQTVDAFQAPTPLHEFNGKNISIPVYPMSFLGSFRQYKPLYVWCCVDQWHSGRESITKDQHSNTGTSLRPSSAIGVVMMMMMMMIPRVISTTRTTYAPKRLRKINLTRHVLSY